MLFSYSFFPFSSVLLLSPPPLSYSFSPLFFFFSGFVLLFFFGVCFWFFTKFYFTYAEIDWDLLATLSLLLSVECEY